MKIFILLSIAVTAAVIADPVADQLPNFKARTAGSIGTWRTSNGAPVNVEDTIALNSNLLSNELFLEEMAHFNRERIPERVISAKGAGAFGFFEVTHNVTGICKAELFNGIGKRTPVAVRFSQVGQDKGEADTNLDARGFAVKFYTEDGNLDIVGGHVPVFAFKDPTLIIPFASAAKRNPATNIKDPNMLWDFITLRPETINFYTYIFGDDGYPDGYRHMPGYNIHTLQVYNDNGESSFIRFHFRPNSGIRNLYPEDANDIACLDPDYAVRDLYNAIESGNFPSWSVSVQVLNYNDVKNAKFDVFDVTKELPLNRYPLRPVGQLVLNRNPINHFSEVEQLAFSATNLVPGILGAPDKLFESRRLAYKDAQRYRLGVNYEKLPVNCPRTNVLGYNRDGLSTIDNNGGGAPNYYPNTFHGPVPIVDKSRPSGLIRIKQVPDSLDFQQSTNRYNKLNIQERQRMAGNIVTSLSKASVYLQQRALDILNRVHPNLAFRVSVGLVDKVPAV